MRLFVFNCGAEHLERDEFWVTSMAVKKKKKEKKKKKNWPMFGRNVGRGGV